jgi:hypothetical protein
MVWADPGSLSTATLARTHGAGNTVNGHSELPALRVRRRARPGRPGPALLQTTGARAFTATSAARAKARAENAWPRSGLSHRVPRAAHPRPDDIEFRPVSDDGELLDLMTLTMDGTLDAHSQQDLALMSARRPKSWQPRARDSIWRCQTTIISRRQGCSELAERIYPPGVETCVTAAQDISPYRGGVYPRRLLE